MWEPGTGLLITGINECFDILALPSTSLEARRRLLTFVVVRLINDVSLVTVWLSFGFNAHWFVAISLSPSD